MGLSDARFRDKPVTGGWQLKPFPFSIPSGFMHKKSFQKDSQTGKKILIVAGEASGDLHGARLVESLLKARPDLSIYGIGGDAMEQQGVRLLVHASRLSVMGFVEILGRVNEILHAYRKVKRSLKRDDPDLVVLIDFPDFNLRVARQAARNGIPVVYYISPQLWAWRRGRIRQIAEDVSHMLVIFPFEEELYKRYGVPVTYVGHPLMDRLESAEGSVKEREVYRTFGFSPLYPVLGLFPGSRTSEVRMLLPILLKSAQALHRRFPRMQFLLGEAPGLEKEIYDRILSDNALPIKRMRQGIGPAIGICDLAIVASGTATLEMALFGVPMVVVYRVSSFTYQLGKLLIRVPSIGMVNLVPQKAVVPELVQNDLNEKNLEAHCLRFFTSSIYYANVKKELIAIREQLGKPGASGRAAQVITELLGEEA